jgi:hypothetical protein
MRTTINIADDIFFAAKDFARRDEKTFGETLNGLMRKGLQTLQQVNTRSAIAPHVESDIDRQFREMGFRTMPSRGGIVTNELINQIREEEGI